MQEYTIEPLDIKDYDKCSNIWDMKKCPYTQQFKNQMMNGDRLVWIYKLNGEFIGEGALVKNNSDADYYIPNQRIYLSRMIVKKEFRNQGIGGIILDYLIRKAEKMGYSEIALGVDTDNHSAIHLYRQKGFDTVIAECEDEHGKFYKLLKRL